MEAKKQLDDKEVYQELRGDIESPLEKIIKKKYLEKNLRNRGDISHETLDYFTVKNPKLGRFYLLPKIHKRLHDVPCARETCYFKLGILHRKNVFFY